MKLTINQTRVEFPTFKYLDIEEEGWYECENWILLFLKNDRQLSPVLAYNGDGKGSLVPVSRGHNWNQNDYTFRKVPFSLTIEN